VSRIAIPSVEQSLEASKPLLAAVHQQLGVVPNLMKLVGKSPAALEGYLSLNGALGKSSLGVALRERIALAVAEFNGCDYCLSAHTYLGEHVAKIGNAEMSAARDFASADAKFAAALHFVRHVLANRGHIGDSELAAIRAAGFDDAAVIELVVVAVLNILTNYVNNVAQTTIDFPAVKAHNA
jgi:uncharacterized peroxidase-related enzyme